MERPIYRLNIFERKFHFKNIKINYPRVDYNDSLWKTKQRSIQQSSREIEFLIAQLSWPTTT